DTNVVVLDGQGNVVLKASGTTTVTASFRGFTAQSVISTLPPFIPPTPPAAVADSVITSVGQSVTIAVLANDYSATRTLDPSIVTLTRAPTNRTALVSSP